MGEGATLRAPTDDDIPALIDLSIRSSRDLGIESAAREEDFTLKWSLPGFDRERHARVAVVDGALVGTAGVQRRHGEAMGGGRVARSHRGRGIGSALLRWTIDAARAFPDEVSHLYTNANTLEPDAVALVESFGFSHARTFFRMLHPNPGSILEPEWPGGTRLDTSLRGDPLIDAIVDAHDNSFIDHWNFHPMPRDEVTHQLQHPDVDPELLFIAFGADGRVAGLNLCFMETGDTFRRGIVGVLGTTRAFRGIGLGRALLRHGVRALADRGATEVVLGVDSANPSGALGLYERNGFKVSMEQRAYVLPLR